MPAKTWIELREESGKDIRSMRFAFLQEHAKADSIEVSHTGVPLSATYHAYDKGNPEPDIPLMSNERQQKGMFHTLELRSEKLVILGGMPLKGIVEYQLRHEVGEMPTLELKLYVDVK